MKRILTAIAVIAASSLASVAMAADAETPVVKGNIEVYGFAKVSVDAITTDAKATGSDQGPDEDFFELLAPRVQRHGVPG